MTKHCTMDHQNNRNFNRSKKRKRGKKGGIRVKNRKRFKRLPLPSMLFGNIRSLTQKEDELYANIRYLHEYRESGIICLQETWLKDEHPDPSIPDFMTIRYCDADIELLSVSLHPFYLPREFNSLKVINVYIPPNGNYMSACEILTNIINDIENSSPDSAILTLETSISVNFINMSLTTNSMCNAQLEMTVL